MEDAALDELLATECPCHLCGQDLSAAGFAQRVAHIKKCKFPLPSVYLKTSHFCVKSLS